MKIFKNTVATYHKRRTMLAALIGIALAIISATPVKATPSNAKETFVPQTGELFWDLDEEIRLRHVDRCTLEKDRYDDLRATMGDLDIFSILDYSDAPYRVVCNSRGLRAEYILREDGGFPNDYEKIIKINNQEIKYYKATYVSIKHLSDKENYQIIYGSTRAEKPLVAKVYSNYRSTLTYPGSTPDAPEKELIINIENLDRADEINLSLAQEKASQLNSKLDEKYRLIASINAGLLVLFAFLLFLLRTRVARLLKLTPKILIFSLSALKYPINSLRACISSKSRIIKRESLSSYSAASELLKWKELRDSGAISEGEFQEIRNRIMKK